MALHDPRGRASGAYLEQEIQGESPLARVARLYEMAAVEVARARARLAAGDPAARGRAINQASRCIAVLQSALNREQGGEVSRNLDRLYRYLLHRLSLAHRHGDDAALGEVAGHLAQLGSAWRTAAARPVEDPAQPEAQVRAAAAR